MPDSSSPTPDEVTPPSRAEGTKGSWWWLTEDVDVRCAHRLGHASVPASQHLVSVEGRFVLVDPDPQGQSIDNCPNIGVGIKRCMTTLPVLHGKSGFVRINGAQVIRADLSGLTDGTPPGSVTYNVQKPGQDLVGEKDA